MAIYKRKIKLLLMIIILKWIDLKPLLPKNNKKKYIIIQDINLDQIKIKV